jgi:hypothetical protein
MTGQDREISDTLWKDFNRFESQSGQTKDYKIGICCFSAKHVALKRMSKDWLAQPRQRTIEILPEGV